MMRTPMERRKAWVRASVRLISKEKISLPAMAVKGVSGPKACAIPGGGGHGVGDIKGGVTKPLGGGGGGGRVAHPWRWRFCRCRVGRR